MYMMVSVGALSWEVQSTQRNAYTITNWHYVLFLVKPYKALGNMLNIYLCGVTKVCLQYLFTVKSVRAKTLLSKSSL